MTPYDRFLLEKLKSKNKPDILENVKGALGHLRFLQGNPDTRTEIKLSVDLFYIDRVTGFLVAPGAIDIRLQSYLPVHIFSLTDYFGGFLNSQNINDLKLPWDYGIVITPDLSYNIVGYHSSLGAAAYISLRPFIQNGDLVLHYDSNILPTPYEGFVRVRCENVSYGTLLNSLVSDLIIVKNIRLIVPLANIDQFMNPLIFFYQSLFGKIHIDSISPRMFIKADDFQQQICDIPINLPITKEISLTYKQQFDCTSMQMILFIEKAINLIG